VQEAVARLESAGFKKLNERSVADFKKGALVPNGKYYFTRNQTSLVAFAVGGKYEAQTGGFTIMGAHTDSPCPKVKPVSKISKHGCDQVGVELYGGGLWNTWFDRDLSIAGRVLVRTSETSYESQLVQVNKPILRIPSLAIHLNRGIYTDGFKPNKEDHVLAVLATSIKSELLAQSIDAKNLNGDHHPLLISAVANQLDVEPSSIVDFELCLYDTQPAQLSGLLEEFIVARGLDNLMMSFVCLSSLIDGSDEKSLAEDTNIRVVALFDNEEVGSTSEHGADSDMMPSVLKRIHSALAPNEVMFNTFSAAMRRSVLISADMAHAIHPNYSSKHEKNHQARMHDGLVIKQNANQRYATTSVTTFFLTELAKKHNLPIQKFVVRNDSGCGSTIGPALSAGCGVRTVDVGIGQWAMHSIRETCGVDDVWSTYQLFKIFFNEFASLDESLANTE
jgi:aspartyl aminopeptidase